MGYRIILLVIFFVAVCLGCGEGQKNPIEDYGDTLVESLDKAEVAALKVNLRTVQAAVSRFQAEKGRLPSDLDELRLQGIPTRYYRYDAETGDVDIAVE